MWAREDWCSKQREIWIPVTRKIELSSTTLQMVIFACGRKLVESSFLPAILFDETP